MPALTCCWTGGVWWTQRAASSLSRSVSLSRVSLHIEVLWDQSGYGRTRGNTAAGAVCT